MRAALVGIREMADRQIFSAGDGGAGAVCGVRICQLLWGYLVRRRRSSQIGGVLAQLWDLRGLGDLVWWKCL